ncbi:hypothetical protein ACJZ2D_009462 [Fusarium nematophilum]
MGNDAEGMPREPYEALSYCWGQSDRPLGFGIILGNGQRMPIDESCHRALVHLQRRGRLSLWVDSVCINQSDVEERSSQVRLMSRIYESADACIVWLDDVNSERGIRRGTACKDGQLPAYGGLLYYLHLPWFRRAWALQEVLLSQKLIVVLEFGESFDELEWEGFWAASLDEMSSTFVPTHLRLMQPALQLYALTSTSESIRFLHKYSWGSTPCKSRDPDLLDRALAEFENILVYSASLQVDDPRDHIYALLGVLNSLGVVVPPPDYSKSSKSVFWDTRKALVKQAGIARMRVRLGNVPSCGQDLYSIFDKRLSNLEQPLVFFPNTFASESSYGDPRWNRAQVLRWLLYHGSAIESHHGRLGRNLEILSFDASKFFQKTFPNWGRMRLKDLKEPQDLAKGREDTAESDTPYQAFFQRYLGHHEQFLRRVVREHLKQSPLSGVLSCCSDEGGSRPSDSDQLGRRRLGLQQTAKVTKGVGLRTAGSIRRRREEDEDDEENSQPPRKQAKGRSLIDPRDRLACPYFQRNPDSARLSRACRDEGFPTIARLKCGMVFEDRLIRAEHNRATVVCDATRWRDSFDPAVGFDEQQKEDLKRKSIRNWQQVFKILFPRDPESSYPPQHPCNMQFVQLLDRFHDHYLRETERLVPQHLGVASCLSALSHQQRDEACAIVSALVRNTHNEILGSFRRDLVHTQTTPAEPTRPSLEAPGGVGPDPRAGRASAAEVVATDASAVFLGFLDQIAPEEVSSAAAFEPEPGPNPGPHTSIPIIAGRGFSLAGGDMSLTSFDPGFDDGSIVVGLGGSLSMQLPQTENSWVRIPDDANTDGENWVE